jgi:transcriptional regulator with XRE-family HTH domain
MSQQEIAARIGATRSAVAHWASGRKKPALYLHVTGLERELGIEYRDWHRLPQECDGAIISGATFKPRATQGTPSAANK